MTVDRSKNGQMSREEENEVLLDAFEIIAKRVWRRIKPWLKKLFTEGDANNANEQTELPDRRPAEVRQDAE